MYKPIGRDKWLNLKQTKLTNKYYKGEYDKDDKPFTAKEFQVHDIIISETKPKG